jgi:predicted dehydrogenase
MVDLFRFAIIGAGDISHKFCEAVNMVENVCVSAVAGKDKGRAAVFAAKNSIPNYFDNYRLMLEAEKPDAVYIATTNNFHFENLMLGIELGIPVLCEKPLALTYKETERVFGTARAGGVFVMEAMWSRFLPAYRKAAELVQAGAVGGIRNGYYQVGFRAHPQHRVLKPELGGGILYDIGVYAIEGLLGIIPGKPSEIIPMVHRAANGVDIADQIMMNFSDCLASLYVTACASLSSLMMLHGDKGSITLPNTVDCGECIFRDEAGDEHSYKFPHKNGFKYEIHHFVSCIREGRIESDIMPHSLSLECARIYDICLGTGPGKQPDEVTL